MNRINQELREATRENNLPEVSRLLRAGADVNVKDGRTPLHWACRWGHVHVVVELLEHGAGIEVKDNTELLTPLHLACCYGRLADVIELLSRGANTEAKDHEWVTPLHDASRIGHVEIVQALLSGGANLLAANNRGQLPIHYAVRRGKPVVAKFLLQHFYATTRRLPIHDLLKDLTWIGDSSITTGGVCNSVPPLFMALHRNTLGTEDVVEIVEYLVSRNPALLSSHDRDGSLPLHIACRRGAASPIVQSLVDLYQASVKCVTPQGDLPLFLACEMPEPSLDTIFLMMKLYPDLVYR
jgi:ankyrin repeat protein